MSTSSPNKVAAYFRSMDYGPAPEGDSLVRQWLTEHDHRFGHFINGRFTKPTRKRLTTNEPGTGTKLATVSVGSGADVEQAVKAARRAQPAWQALGGVGRARHIYALARMVQRNARLFAVLESLDNGKPIRESRDIDIPLVARHFYHHAGWAQLQDQELAGYEPLGVAGQIVPWNFPLLMVSWKTAPAMALGNTVVLKPAEQTPLSALLFAELATRAGLPAGVLNIVTGAGSTGAQLARSPGIDKLAFTGSTEVGRKLRELTAGSGKALTLELGGKSPFIVFDDADLEAAVEGIVDGVWFNQGQVCCAGSRLLVQENIALTFHAKLVRRLRSLRVGKPLDKNTDVGAIISPAQHKRITALVAEGVAAGAELHQTAGAVPKGGCYFPPTLLANVSQSARVAIEEIFGPVLVSMTFRTPDEAVELANNTRYGLAASVYSETIGLALDIAPKLAAGVVWINATNLFDAAVGFGGYRESGFGREGGMEGALDYLKPSGWRKLPQRKAVRQVTARTVAAGDNVDRTAKHYIGGKQKRPDGGYCYPVAGSQGDFLGEAARGNRKDIRDAVEAARKSSAWSALSSHGRAQVLYFMAENLDTRSQEFVTRITSMTGVNATAARREVSKSVERLFTYAAWADKYEGRVHEPPIRGVALAMNEPLGTVGVVCPPEAPLLAFVSLCAPLLATGNRVIALPSQPHPFAATDFYQVLETSDLPGGTLNIVTGLHDDMVPTLAGHYDVDGIWVFSSAKAAQAAERLSAANLKRVFTDHGKAHDWQANTAQGRDFLRRAVQVKNVWIPYGE